MGIIVPLLFAAGLLGKTFYVPFWVVIICYLVIALSNLASGWRIVNTMGKKITRLDTLKSCCAESGAAGILFITAFLGIPVSTTQTITGSIIGVGLIKGLHGLDWQVIKKILWAWVLTLPVAGLISRLLFPIKLLYYKGKKDLCVQRHCVQI